MEIANSLSKQLSNCILPEIPHQELDKLIQEFKIRAANEIPPGYKDQHKEDVGKKRCGRTNEAGDYIIWEEILRWASQAKKDVILISNENKTDWIWKEHGFVIGPRWELRKEFYERTEGKLFHIIKLDEFLKQTDDIYSDPELDVITRPVKERTISDKKIVSFTDEFDELYIPTRFRYESRPEIDMSDEMLSKPQRKRTIGIMPKFTDKQSSVYLDEYWASRKNDVILRDKDYESFIDEDYNP